MEQQIDAVVLKEIFNDIDYEIRSYSGRGMYGSHCLAVECDNPSGLIAEVFLHLAENRVPYDKLVQVAEALKDSRTDSMGTSSIVYWPNITIS